MMLQTKQILGSCLKLSKFNQIFFKKPILIGKHTNQRNISSVYYSFSKKNIFIPIIALFSTTKQSNINNILQKLKSQINELSLSLASTEQLNQLQRIVYPEALLHGQQKVGKLTKLYDVLIDHLDIHDPENKHFEHLIQAGDFYHQIKVRRLKALKPYLKAKQQLQKLNLHKHQNYQQKYNQICLRIDKLIKQDIQQGECRNIQHYYDQAIENQKNGNQLQALYYYYKGICISEYQKIPDKLIHFEMLAHYTFLTELMKPKCPYKNEVQHYESCLQKYNEIQKIGNNWWKQQFLNSKDEKRKNKCQQSLYWVMSNKGNILFHGKKYLQAIKIYQKVIDFYENSQKSDLRLKIVKIVQNLFKCYEQTGQLQKGLKFLQESHDIIKKQIQQNPLLKTRYLRHIDELLISRYKILQERQHKQDYENKINLIKNQLRQIVS